MRSSVYESTEKPAPYYHSRSNLGLETGVPLPPNIGKNVFLFCKRNKFWYSSGCDNTKGVQLQGSLPPDQGPCSWTQLGSAPQISVIGTTWPPNLWSWICQCAALGLGSLRPAIQNQRRILCIIAVQFGISHDTILVRLSQVIDRRLFCHRIMLICRNKHYCKNKEVFVVLGFWV